METKSIDERAERYYHMWIYGEFNECVDALRGIATEQDRIARAEERERCIKAACKELCRICNPWGNLCNKCDKKDRIRKALEEGGNNGNM